MKLELERTDQGRWRWQRAGARSPRSTRTFPHLRHAIADAERRFPDAELVIVRPEKAGSGT